MRYTKKPVTIEAVQWTGENYEEMRRFVPFGVRRFDADGLHIKTLEGDMYAAQGDYIIKGVQGEFYPCKPDIFAKTYQPEELENVLPKESVTSERQDSCPFCDSEEIVIVTEGLIKYSACLICGARGPGELTESEAVKSWNDRTEATK